MIFTLYEQLTPRKEGTDYIPYLRRLVDFEAKDSEEAFKRAKLKYRIDHPVLESEFSKKIREEHR